MKERDIPKAYDPGAIEPRWAEQWVREQLFTPEVAARLRPPDKGTFSLAIPPPNVTGSLHMGHMLEHTQIDTLMRWRRMQGYRVLWLPGTDHAGIATQVVVERQLAEQGLKRQDIGREEFERRVWQWKAQSGDRIKIQMTRLGASCDWTRERFTLDPPLYRAVLEAFLRLYREGLIYRGRYLVNWCPRCLTALSDLEVVHREREDKLYFIRYPVVGTEQHLVVATTRPETMLGDTAVAVHPADDRYRQFVGRKALLPLMNRELPILADDFVDRDFGTGVVKVTPAHDPDDFQVGRRHSLPEITVLDDAACMNQNAGPYQGLDRYEARLRIVEDLKKQKLLEKTEPYRHGVGLCDRCKTPVEPRISVQWFCRMKELAAPAIEVVRRGLIRVVPENYATIYLDWMERIYDWCISRQLWWGHRIPIWHCRDCAALTPAQDSAIEVVGGRPQLAHPPQKCQKCGSAHLTQDPDVLDTWFSSALWPFSTLGWPDETPDLRAFYPTTLMINGFDILFFWDARMIMTGLKFIPQQRIEDRLPFRTLYIHAIVRDPYGQKMSKTRGNVVDPLEIIEEYGTDATRFTLAIMAAPGTDIALSPDRLRSYRAFANKIWNAARFMLMNVDKVLGAEVTLDTLAGPDWRAKAPLWMPHEQLPLVHRWMFSRIAKVAAKVDRALEEFRFHEAADELYHFFWHEFCDWYIELLKPRLSATEDPNSDNDWRNLFATFDTALRLLHPFMPFITEELWQRLPQLSNAKSIALQPFPKGYGDWIDEEAEREMTLVQEAIIAFRNLRAEMKIDPNRLLHGRLAVHYEYHPVLDKTAATESTVRQFSRFFPDQNELLTLITNHRVAIQRLAHLAKLEILPRLAPGLRPYSARFAVGLESTDPAVEAPDLRAEVARLRKEKEKLEKELGGMRARLADQEFRRKAPEDVVRGLEQRQAEYNTQYQKVAALLSQLETRLSSGNKQNEAQP